MPRTSVPDGKPIVDAIKAHLGSQNPIANNARFITAWNDLNGDGKDEALVYLIDPMMCGSGGCNLYILTDQGSSKWAVESNLTVARLPIYRLTTKTDGWADLGVSVSGGGLRRMVMKVPHASGGYARNPTVSPAVPTGIAGAKTLIAEEAATPVEGKQ